jgi:hypothetical protein
MKSERFTSAVVIAVTALSLSLGGCSSITGAPNQTDVIGALKEIASDPRCGHVDRIQGNLGGLGGNNLSVFLERTCPPAPVPDPTLFR